jgi:DNA-binding SARP family transcriptional activator
MAGIGAEFRMLGPIQVRNDDRLISLTARGQGVLAALLLNANLGVSTDQLIERVWGERPLPERPRSAVQTYISLLRQALADLPEVAVVRQAAGYMITVDDGLVDVHRFRSLVRLARLTTDHGEAMQMLERALGHWRGEALGFQDSPYFNSMRNALSLERKAAERDLTDLQLRHGLHDALLARLSYWCEEQPLDERLAAQLMLALFRSGRQADALRHYHDVRIRLAQELGTDPGESLQQLYGGILRSDPDLAAVARAEVAPPRANPPSYPLVQPRQLPAAPRAFTGRASVLAAISAAVGGEGEERRAASVVISGSRGIGKSAVALYWSHRSLDRYPDGQLFACLHRRNRRWSVPASEVLGRFLAALGVEPEQIPDEPEERSALYHSVLSGRRVLVVLDDVHDSEQVRPLLPGSDSCQVIATSRSTLTGLVAAEGAFPVRVGALTPGESRELVTRQVGAGRVAAEPAIVEELIALCDGRPHLLSAAAAHVAVDPGLRFTKIVHDLRVRMRGLPRGESGDSGQARPPQHPQGRHGPRRSGECGPPGRSNGPG